MLLIEITCSKCGQKSNENGHANNGICSTCKGKEAKDKKDKYLDRLKMKTLYERVALIEERLYDMDENPENIFDRILK